MAPAMMELVPRIIYNNNCDPNYSNCYSSWSSWGRWVALVCIVCFFLFIALAFSCINSRRRRRSGVQPRYGTGWMAGKTPVGHNGPSYNGGYNNNQYQNGAAPPYQPPQYTGNTFNRDDGYYGQQSGIELQQPANTYGGNRGENVYNAPQGPPPGKQYGGDGIIR